jgi:hypothetical protein
MVTGTQIPRSVETTQFCRPFPFKKIFLKLRHKVPRHCDENSHWVNLEIKDKGTPKRIGLIQPQQIGMSLPDLDY